MIYESSEKLAAAAAEWQKILRLDEWLIVARIARASQMPDGKMGLTSWMIRHKEAIIKILDAEDWDNSDFALDQEQVLVHELLHLKLAWTERFCPVVEAEPKLSALFDDAQEYAIDSMAKSFVDLKRNNS